MGEIRIILVGGRPFPNYQGIISQITDIEKLAFIYTEEGKRNYQNLLNALAKIYPEKYNLQNPLAKIVDAYSLEDVYQALSNFRTMFPHQTLSIDITSAPKIASFGVVNYVIRDKNSKLLFVDSRNAIIRIFQSKDDQLHQISSIKLSPPGVNDFLAAYGRETSRNLDLNQLGITEEVAFNVAKYLVNQGQQGVKFLDTLRKLGEYSSNNLHGARVIEFYKGHYNKIIAELTRLGFFSDVKKIKSKVIVKIYEEKFQFLNGKWLDFYVSKMAETTGLFADTAYSLEISVGEGAKNELDFIGILKENNVGAAVIAECKTGRPSKKHSNKKGKVFSSEELDKLHSVAELIGGNFVLQIFITNRFKSSENKDRIKSFEERAKARNIQIIYGEDLPNLSGKLKEIISNFKPI